MADWLKQAQVPAWVRANAPVLQLAKRWWWLPGVGWLYPAMDAQAATQMPNAEPQWLRATD